MVRGFIEWLIGGRGGLMVSVHDSGSSGPGSGPGPTSFPGSLERGETPVGSGHVLP